MWVVVDDEDGELYVTDEVTVFQTHEVFRQSHETHTRILDGDGYSDGVDAVTPEVAQWILNNFGVDVADHDIRVINPDDPAIEII